MSHLEKVIFDVSAWSVVYALVDEKLKNKCSHCNDRGSKRCFYDVLLRARKSLKKPVRINEDEI